MAPNSSTTDEARENYEAPNIKGDRSNFVLLTILYVLQGAVGGIASAIPYVMQKRNVTYEDQATFNIVWYALSLKIFWAPIVDSVYWSRLGRRKTWLITTQYFTGILLLILSIFIDGWLSTEDGKRKPNVTWLTVIFFFCILSNSVQDIALDAWTLTALKKNNVAYSAVCQSIGLTTGYVLISASFMILESKDFRNMFHSVPQENGFVTFSEFIFFWSLAFIATSSFLAISKKENEDRGLSKINDKRELRITRTYILVWDILKIRPVQMMCFILLTRHIGTAPIHSVASLKLLDAGITRDKLALLTLPLFPVQILSPLLLNRYVTGPRPMRVFLFFYTLKLLNGLVYTALVHIISRGGKKANPSSTWSYWPLIFVHNFDSFAFFVTMMAVVAMFARISDPRFGAVYMTLLSSVSNVGNSWISTVCLWSLNVLTIKTCGTIGNAEEASSCIEIDGLYVEVILCSLIGTLWIFWAREQIHSLEKTDAEAFVVKRRAAVAVNSTQLPLVVVTEHR